MVHMATKGADSAISEDPSEHRRSAENVDGKSFLQWAELRVIQRITRLPKPVLLGLSGKKQVVCQGLSLGPEIQFLLAGRKLVGGARMANVDPRVTRKEFRAEAQRYAGDGSCRRSEDPGAMR